MTERAFVWTFRRCPYAIRACMALDVAEIDVEYREIILRDKPTQLLQASPKGTVPILVLQNGEVIDESIDIMRWALRQNDTEAWLGRSDAESKAIQTWVDAVEEFKPNLDRYKYPNRFEGVDRESVLEQSLSYLQRLNAALEQSPSLLDARITFADIATFPFVRQFHFTDPDRLNDWGLAPLLVWLELFLKSPRFERVMVKRALWEP